MTNPGPSGPSELSERELEILRLVATGAGNKEIAQRLYISSNTVKVHLRNIFTKIGAASRTEAAMYAVRIGLVATGAPQVANDDDSLVTNEAQPFPIASQVIPDVEDQGGQTGSRLRWLLAAGIIIALLALVAIGYQLTRNNGPVATLPPPHLLPLPSSSGARWPICPPRAAAWPQLGMKIMYMPLSVKPPTGRPVQWNAMIPRQIPGAPWQPNRCRWQMPARQ